MNTPEHETAEPDPCFADSRRLTGPNRYFASTAAILEPLGAKANDATAHRYWQALVIDVCRQLGWADGLREVETVIHRHAQGTYLVVSAPEGLLFTATEINEWAWEVASGEFEGLQKAAPRFDRLHPLLTDANERLNWFQQRCKAEQNVGRDQLVIEASRRHLPVIADDETLSIGIGKTSLGWPLAALPAPDAVQWGDLHAQPVALVTGSNGKTTTVRLLAALLKANGHTPGYCSTEGVVIDGVLVDGGDYSGPAGARQVLRDARIDAAVLETARGGIARRGLAVHRADVAIITNISADHFGEYGIDSLADLADIKLTVARPLDEHGTLVLNADDATLALAAARATCKKAWFALDFNHQRLREARRAGAMACGVEAGVLRLFDGTHDQDLGRVADMPLTLNGAAQYNVANIAAAALAATALGIAPPIVKNVLHQFGQKITDNPGRLEVWHCNGATVLIDYAHNPEGLQGLLTVARARQKASSANSRLGLLLGQAGNRSDEAIEQLVQVAIDAAPDYIVIKELGTMLRGRSAGEVPRLIAHALAARGYPPTQITFGGDETEAAQALLALARPGDMLVMPIHNKASREALTTGWAPQT